jgi:ATP-dependent Clp protease protease subunit
VSILKVKQEEAYAIEVLHDHLINPITREIYLHGAVNSEEEPGVDWRMSNEFIKNLHYLEATSKDPITVHMATVGGDWADGMAIHNVIACSECHITIIAYRAARSMSSIIFQAADERVLTPDAGMMLHYGLVSFTGTGVEERTNAALNEKLNRRMMEIYAEKMKECDKHSEKTINTIIRYTTNKLEKFTDWWITSEEAIEEGLADKIKEFHAS